MKKLRYIAMASIVALFFACSGNNSNAGNSEAESEEHVHAESCEHEHEHGECCEHEHQCPLADNCANSENCDFNHGKGEPCGRGRAAMQESFTVEEEPAK